MPRFSAAKCSRRNYDAAVEVLFEVDEALPPFTSKVVGFVDDERADAGAADGVEELLAGRVRGLGDFGAGGVLFFGIVAVIVGVGSAGVGAVEALVGGDGEQFGVVQIARDPVAAVGVRGAEQGDEAVEPLVADGDGRGEDQGGVVEAADDLQAEDRFAGAGGGDDVEVVVVEVRLQLVEDPGLVIAPGKAESDIRRKRFHGGIIAGGNAGSKVWVALAGSWG